ncbi:hypothetical protein EDD15DRAFT_2318042, partial [Pisolithus albus]
YFRWRLLVNDSGRHTWRYMRTGEQCDVRLQNEVDKYYWLGSILLVHAVREWTPLFRLTVLPELPRASKKQTTPRKPHGAGFVFCKHLQSHDGTHWSGESGGPKCFCCAGATSILVPKNHGFFTWFFIMALLPY